MSTRDDMRTLAGQRQRGGAALTVRCAGHDRDLP